MRKISISLVGILFLAGSCQKKDLKSPVEEEQLVETVSQRMCPSQEILEVQMAADPEFRKKRMELEEYTARVMKDPKAFRLGTDGKIIIPVVVNVLYNTAVQNISDAQIASQIAVLNEDYTASNADLNKTSAFSTVKANVGITFEFVKTVRKASSKKSWSLNDDMKRASAGGIDPTNPSTTLNMWVVNKMSYHGGTILGYAQFPGGPLATDGVVIGYNFFGRTGAVSAPFDKGRTATHEVGHWMNLYHIWGDATCGTDEVGDTPTHNGPNYGCPAAGHKSTCAGTPVEMTMNYMDYTDDACMYMFSLGQKSRMDAIFTTTGVRSSFR